jgi:hypothetical protein
MLKAMWNKLTTFSLYDFWAWAGGRNFSLAVWFAGTAFWLAKHGMLRKEYAGAMIAIQGFTTWRSVHEDQKEVAMRGEDRNDSQQASHNLRADAAQTDQKEIALRGQDRKDASSDIKTPDDCPETVPQERGANARG